MGVSIIKSSSDKNGYVNTEVMEIMLDDKSDLKNITEKYSPGSIAYTADMSFMAQLNAKGEWVTVIG